MTPVRSLSLRIALGQSCAVLIGAAPPAGDNEQPEKIGEAFAAAKEFELYSPDPDPVPKGGENFHGWNIPRKTLLKSEDAVKVRDAVEKARKDSNGDVAGCFSPRHGIRIIREKGTVDPVICFACLSGAVFEGKSRIGAFLTAATPGPILKDVLVAAKVPAPARERPGSP
ncbi:MAG TPA: hypothetical protein VM222_00445 [Planctomycetota bacterium]|nr:hypothetical protein [Planctomycetota bacterium]